MTALKIRKTDRLSVLCLKRQTDRQADRDYCAYRQRKIDRQTDKKTGRLCALKSPPENVVFTRPNDIVTTWVTAEDVKGLALDASHFILGNDVVQSDSCLGFERTQKLSNKHKGAVSLLAECASLRKILRIFLKFSSLSKNYFLTLTKHTAE